MLVSSLSGVAMPSGISVVIFIFGASATASDETKAARATVVRIDVFMIFLFKISFS
jgi:hypothetical protein